VSEGQKKEAVLSDHHRAGKRLIPPFVSGIDPLGEVPWTKVIVPELFWIGLLQKAHGEERSAALSVSLMQATDKVRRPDGAAWYGTASSFRAITGELAEGVRSALEAEGTLFSLADALRPLLVLYPDCPLALLAPDPAEA
jgi:hypothetical protein